MHDREIVLGLFSQILEAGEIALHRFEPICSPEDFKATDAGREKLDAICLPLIAIGDNLKRIERITDGKILARYPDVEWAGAMAARNRIVHGYFDVDAVIVFDICKHYLPDLLSTVRTAINDLESE